MSQMKTWKRCFVLLSVLGIGGSFAGSEIAAWQFPGVPQAGGFSKARGAGQFANVDQSQAAPKLDADFEPLVMVAMSDDAQKADAATQELRRRGRRALEFVLSRTDPAALPRWKMLADTVAAQRDSHFSGLYWHTDLAAAQEVAKRENKPILSLRLLGNLTDELSCANSRFFRTTLYPHTAVRTLLAERFVLHWQSVRAVPIITIDFGDGRSIKRTITGNSLHLVLDARGRTVDVLPGLYGAGFFARVLQESESLAKRAADLNNEQFGRELVKFHQQQLNNQEARWSEDWQQLKADRVPKFGAELDDVAWAQLAQRYVADVALDGMAAAAVQAKQPAEVAGLIAKTKYVSETPAMKLARNLIPVIGQDTVKNEYNLHRQIHQWLAKAKAPGRDILVARIYNELFLSPLNDPWYGLSKPDVYSAVENDGRQNVITTTQNVGHRR
ncbi:MAG: hypothetical protein IAG10_13245 [Planctomycetaceae bacterium]|nr:hypothetical protein [Planctomycetaceae bacterium]